MCYGQFITLKYVFVENFHVTKIFFSLATLTFYFAAKKFSEFISLNFIEFIRFISEFIDFQNSKVN